MRRLIAAAAVMLALLAWAGAVQAACTTTTYFLPNGTMRICTTCCDPNGTNCTVFCV